MIDPITLQRAEAAGLPAAEAHPDSPLVCFPMRFEWEIAQGRLIQKCTQRNCTVCDGPPRTVERDTSWPDPVQDGRQLEPSEIHDAKVAVRDLVRESRSHGWTAKVTEAVGSWPSVGQRPSAPRTSLAVRLWRADQRAVAVYVEGSTWSWDTLRYWSLGQFPAMADNIEAFKVAIMGPLCKLAWPGAHDWSCPYFGPLHGPDKPKRVR